VIILICLLVWCWMNGTLVYALAKRHRGHGVAGLIIAAAWPVAVPAEMAIKAIVKASFWRVTA